MRLVHMHLVPQCFGFIKQSHKYTELHKSTERNPCFCLFVFTQFYASGPRSEDCMRWACSHQTFCVHKLQVYVLYACFFMRTHRLYLQREGESCSTLSPDQYSVTAVKKLFKVKSFPVPFQEYLE